MDKKINLWPKWADEKYFKLLPVDSELADLLRKSNEALKDIVWKE